MDESENSVPVESTQVPEQTETPVEAPVEPVAETSAPEGEVVLGTNPNGGVEVEPTPVIQ